MSEGEKTFLNVWIIKTKIYQDFTFFIEPLFVAGIFKDEENQNKTLNLVFPPNVLSNSTGFRREKPNS